MTETLGSLHYAFVHGVLGASRLEVLTRLSWPSSYNFLVSQGVREGMSCLEAGCGAGSITRHLKDFLGSDGGVTGFDMDEETIELARKKFSDTSGVSFQVLDLEEDGVSFDQQFDVVYCRHLLEHLADPETSIRKLSRYLKPGGLFIAQTIDCEGQYCWPDNDAYQKSAELLARIIDVRGGHSDCGQWLPSMLRKQKFLHINIEVENLVYLEGEGKQFVPLTMETLRKGLLEEGLLEKDEFRQLLSDLRQFCNQPDSVVSLPRFVHCAGRKPC
ncbi:hypothetical protein GZ77_20205 [Endozoicomonas montiporae]|uniref:Methyltransferase domain-containing protein n=2 Tax=Endozoicomonas montiporae TaxID=1027273 RepID=A0A081N2W5_9GAMM|nr:class I SAM-dependent methyltransferase [Endozoicomonas montiporae]AMO58058.1 3-demethylubiquinone-9 3-methyltransferase [Endozoicomonas montiporae CL-33]KEQ12788.1 hypothetical protein GZ77_20205 [Endozoicomonas montiporae]